jgi:UDP-N-acetylmuramyl tripeptide synthase
LANTAGANLASGVATTLLSRADEQLGLFEVDEAALPHVALQLRPRVVVLMNLFRDQLDRYGELEAIAARWAEMIDRLPADVVLVVNADDPTLAGLPLEGRRVVWFGLADTRHALPEVPHAADATVCPRCASRLEYDPPLLGHLGIWRCPGCGHARPSPEVVAERIELDASRGQSVTVRRGEDVVSARLSLPGLHNTYNATAAVAASLELGVSPTAIARALEATPPAFGRAERVVLGGRQIQILLAKNPAGVNQNVRTLLLEEGPLDLLLCLNDRTADGRDVSWIWDVDYEPLLERAAHLTVTGDRAYDLALRLRYADVSPPEITVEESGPAALDRALERTDRDGTLFVLPTYTAMLELREDLVRRGAAEAFWRDG